MKRPSGILTVDVEDWFHSENLPITRQDWDSQPSLVVDNVKKLLDLFEKYNAKGTFFILGWVAQRYPDLVLEIQSKGHEIASHGYNHQLIYRMSKEEFREDVKKSKDILEQITQEKITGYRASNFSITDWAIKILQEEGFLYDSSLCVTSVHDRYGKLDNYQVSCDDDIIELEPNFWEVTIPTLNLAGLSLPWGGGGYFRLLPYPVFKTGIVQILKKKRNFLFYIHPREIDPEQPYIKELGTISRFRHYVGLKHCEARLISLLHDLNFSPIRDKLNAQHIIP